MSDGVASWAYVNEVGGGGVMTGLVDGLSWDDGYEEGHVHETWFRWKMNFMRKLWKNAKGVMRTV